MRLQNLPTVEYGIFRWSAIQSRELHSFILRACREKVQEGRRHSTLDDLSGYVCVFATHRRRRRRSGTLERDQEKKMREKSLVSDATAGGDYLLAVRLMTPPALVTTTRRRCRR